MREYDIFLPTTRNDGRPIEEAALEQVKQSLTDAFGGYTHLTHHNEGVWRMGGVTFREKVTVVRVLDDGSSEFAFLQFKQNLEQLVDQKSVLIVTRHVSVV